MIKRIVKKRTESGYNYSIIKQIKRDVIIGQTVVMLLSLAIGFIIGKVIDKLF